MDESFVASGLEKKQMWRPLRIDSAYLPSRLLQQFLVAAAVTIFCSMTLLAYAVSQSLQSSLTITAAEEGALLVDYFIGPYIQELTTAKTLSPETVSKLDELLKTKLGDRTKVLKISLRDGTLVYSTNKELIGSKFPSPAIDEAFLGKTAGTFDDLEDEDEHFERQMRRPLMEIYAPLYQTDSRDIIAVGKIYNTGERLVADLRSIRLMSIAIVAAVTAPMIMAKASRCTTPKKSPRFHASEKPNGAAKQAVSNSAPQVRLKKGAPTVIFSPVNCSSASG